MSKLEELRKKTQERLQAARNRLDETRQRLGRVEDRLEDTRARLTNQSGLNERSSLSIPIEHRDAREHLDRKDPQSGSVQVSNEGFPRYGNSSKQQANRKALFIGNDGPPLTQCVNDASDMETVFSKLDYQTTLLADQSVEEMSDAFDRLIESMGSDDEIIISFSGHGCCYKREVYLEGINGGLLNLHEQLDRIQKRNPRMVLSIIDACRNKSENPSMENTKGDVASIAKYAGADSSWLHSKVRGQAEIYATSHNNPAVAFRNARNSIFTHCLLDELKKPGRKAIRDVITRVRQAVARETNNKQIVSFHDELSGEFYFSR